MCCLLEYLFPLLLHIEELHLDEKMGICIFTHFITSCWGVGAGRPQGLLNFNLKYKEIK